MRQCFCDNGMRPGITKHSERQHGDRRSWTATDRTCLNFGMRKNLGRRRRTARFVYISDKSIPFSVDRPDETLVFAAIPQRPAN